MREADSFAGAKAVPRSALKQVRDDAKRDTSRDSGARPRFELIRAADLEYREPEYLVSGMLETETLGQIFGDPGCGKSFVALDMACCVSTGRAFHGRDVKQGAVVYIAGEGHNGIKRRLAAWERHTGQSLADAPLYVSRVAAQFLDGASAEAVTEAVDGIVSTVGLVRLIVVDTLARNFGPGDENGTAEMSRFVAAMDDMKARYDAVVLIVHHTGHADKQRARGNTAMFGALDHAYRVEKADELVTITCTKMKDGTEPAPVAFKLESVTIGTGGDGTPVTSAVLVPTEAPACKPRRLTRAQDIGMKSFEAARRAAGHALDLGAEVSVEQWREQFHRMSTQDTTEAKKKAFQRVRSDLVATKQLVVENNRYRLARVTDEHLTTEGTAGHSGTSRDMSRSVPGQSGHVSKTCPDVPPDEWGLGGERDMSRLNAQAQSAQASATPQPWPARQDMVGQPANAGHVPVSDPDAFNPVFWR